MKAACQFFAVCSGSEKHGGQVFTLFYKEEIAGIQFMQRLSVLTLFIFMSLASTVKPQSQSPLPDPQQFLAKAREKLTGGLFSYPNPVNENLYVWEEEFTWREVNTKGEVRKLKLHQVVEVSVDGEGHRNRRITRVNGGEYRGIPPAPSWKAYNQNFPHKCHSWKGPREHPEFLWSAEHRERLWHDTEFRLIGRERLNGSKAFGDGGE